MAHHDRRPGRAAIAGPGQPRLHRRRARPAVGRGLHLPALPRGPGVLRVRDRRLVPARGRLAARVAHAHRSRPRRAQNSLVAAPARRRRRARASLRRRQPRSNTPASTSGRSSTTTASSRRSDRSATPTTTRSPRASSTPSRPNSSVIASGARAPRSNWRSSSGSAGLTTSASTRTSVISPRPNSRARGCRSPSHLPASPDLDLMKDELGNQAKRSPRNPARLAQAMPRDQLTRLLRASPVAVMVPFQPGPCQR